MITLDDLRFIDALSRTGSLSAAARALNVTPPAFAILATWRLSQFAGQRAFASLPCAGPEHPDDRDRGAKFVGYML